jgi:pimeloyl-ACP methyl ester carboxylesterase
VRSRFVDNATGLAMHLLEAGFDDTGRPTVLLLHGFPELAYSWRGVMPRWRRRLPRGGAGPARLRAARKVAMRATTATGVSCRFLNLVRDVTGLLRRSACRACMRWWATTSARRWRPGAALTRPDVFPRVVLMSAPFGGAPALPLSEAAQRAGEVHAALAALPRPAQALPALLHHARGRWRHVALRAGRARLPARLLPTTRARTGPTTGRTGWRPWGASELAKMPTYYVMDLHETMAQTVAHEMPSAEAIAACRWLPDHELRVYSGEYGRNGFQGGLQWYRCATDASCVRELQLFSGRTIDVPSMFIAGRRRLGRLPKPGVVRIDQASACTPCAPPTCSTAPATGCSRRQPEAVSRLLMEFMP